MRFVCESCRAQYMISDEKVGPRGVKFRCRKCGHVVLVKRDTSSKPLGVDASAAAPVRAPATSGAAEAATAAGTEAGPSVPAGGPGAAEGRTPSQPLPPPGPPTAEPEVARSSGDEGASTVVVQIPALQVLSKPLQHAPDENTDETVVASPGEVASRSAAEPKAAPTWTQADRGEQERTSPLIGALAGATEPELPTSLVDSHGPRAETKESGRTPEQGLSQAGALTVMPEGGAFGFDDSGEATNVMLPAAKKGDGAAAEAWQGLAIAPPEAALRESAAVPGAASLGPWSEQGGGEGVDRAADSPAATLDGLSGQPPEPEPEPARELPAVASPVDASPATVSEAAPPLAAEPPAPKRPNAAEMAAQLRGVGMPDSSLLGGRDGGALQGLFGADDDEIGAIFDQVLGPGTPGPGSGAGRQTSPRLEEDRESTRVLDVGVARRLADESAPHGQSPAGGSEPPPPSEEVPQSDWYVAIDDKETGPLTLDAVKMRWDRGELGPDSLCWRQGMGDWVPVSEVKMLAGVLVPKPPRPIVVPAAASAAASPSSVIGVPSSVSFSSGGLAQAGRHEVSVPMPGVATMAALSEADDVDPGGWRPSAASALASLVSAEMDALAKPARGESAAARREDGAGLGRGRNGSFEPGSPVETMGAGAYALSATQGADHARELPRSGASSVARAPAFSQSNLRPAPEPPAARGEPDFAAEAYVPPPVGPSYSSPAVTTYQPSTSRNLIIAVVSAAGVAFVVLVGLVVWLALRTPTAPGIGAAPPSASAGSTGAPSDAPAPAPQAPGAAAGTGTTAGGGTAAAPPPTQPAVAAAPTGQQSPPAAPTAAVSPVPTPTPTPVPVPAKVAAAAEPVERPEARERPSARERRRDVREEARPAREAVARAEPVREQRPSPAESGGGASTDDDFTKAFGGGGGGARSDGSAEAGRRPKEVYVPPAPGAGGPVKDRLETSDVMEVVISQKAALVRCSAEQKKRDPGVSGKLVMQWTVLPSGRTTQVSCVTEEFKKSYFAACVGGLIKQMSFPRHRVQGEPVQFPFKF